MPDKDATPSDEAIIHAIQVIHSFDMKVMLKPRVDLYNGKWRGGICFDNEENWHRWFNSYKNFICHYAQLAEKKMKSKYFVLDVNL